MATWHTADSVRTEWPDAEQISDPTLTELLAVAQAQVIAYAPAVALGTTAAVTAISGTGILTLARSGSVVTAVLTRNDPTVNQTFTLPTGFVASVETNVNDVAGWVSIFENGCQVSKTLPNGTTFAYMTADPMPGDAIPDAWRLAQRMQAKNLFTAGAVDASGGIGDDTFVVRPHPLDWHIKNILRPKAGVPVVG